MTKIAISIAEFCRDYGVAKTTAWKLAREGKISIARVGRRSLVIVASADALIANATDTVPAERPQGLTLVKNDAASEEVTPHHNR